MWGGRKRKDKMRKREGREKRERRGRRGRVKRGGEYDCLLKRFNIV